MHDDLGHDESASIVIVGGGPHALAVLAALQESLLDFQQDNNDTHAGPNSDTGPSNPLPPPCHGLPHSWLCAVAQRQKSV